MMLTERELECKYKALKSDQRKSSWMEQLSTLFVLMGLIAVAGISTFFTGPITIWSWIALLTFLVLIVVFIKWMRTPSKKLDQQELIFMKFYETYDTLKQYKIRHYDTSKSIEKLNGLAYFIERWTKNAPEELSSLPRSIGENLRERIIPLFKENKTAEIDSFTNTFMNVVLLIHDREPTIEILKNFNITLESFMSVPQIPPKKETNRTKYHIVTIVFTGVAFGIIFFEILIHMKMEQSYALVYSTPSSIGLMAFLVAVKGKFANKS